MSDRDELEALILMHFNPSPYVGSSWKLNPGAAADEILSSGWLADHDKEVAVRAIEEYRNLIERTTRLHAYAMDEDDWDEHKRLVAALTNYAAAIRSGSTGDTE